MQRFAIDVQGVVIDVQRFAIDVQGVVIDVQRFAIDVRGLVIDVRGIVIDMRSPTPLILNGDSSSDQPMQPTEATNHRRWTAHDERRTIEE